MSDEAAFLEVLNSCLDAEGDVGDDTGWTPPANNEYTVFLDKYVTGIKEKDGISNGWSRATFKIMTGEFEGRTFPWFHWLPPGVTKIGPGMGDLLRLGTCLAGRKLTVAELPEAHQQVVDGCGSAVMNIRLFKTTAKKTGREYTNIRYLGLVP